jgi:hypothetical protein
MKNAYTAYQCKIDTSFLNLRFVSIPCSYIIAKRVNEYLVYTS